MDAYRENTSSPGSWAASNPEIVEAVLTRILENGAMASRHFDRPEGPRPEAWDLVRR